MKCQPYPNYRSIKESWIGELPQHWNVKRIKYTTYVKGRVGWQGLKSGEFIDEGPFLVTGTDFKDGHVNWDTCYHVSEQRYTEDPYIQLQEKDLLVTKDGTIGKTAVIIGLPGKACLNSGIFVVRPLLSIYLTEYLYWVLNSDVFKAFIKYQSKGTTIDHLYQNIFVDFAFPVPSLQEQENIISFLNRKIAQIDLLLSKKEWQIKLLQEKRDALINLLVTKGLNPKAKLIDSEIIWIGKIPEGWTVISLNNIIDPYRKITYGIVQPGELDPNGRFMVRGQDYSSGWVDSSEIFRVSPHIENPYKRSRLKAGDIVMTIVGAGVGNIEIVPMWLDGANITQTTARIAISSKFALSKFIAYQLQSSIGKANIELTIKGAAQPGLNLGHVAKYKIILPPLPEQQQIVSFLDIEIPCIEELKIKKQRQIELLQEYRSSLIFETVTGKIDVRSEFPDANKP